MSIAKPQRLGIAILVILYVVGLAGILWPLHPDFIRLTPANLLVSLLIVLAFHHPWSPRFVLFLLAAYALGFGAEWVGVQTGWLFGDYAYGPVLGPKWMDTPFMIGVNWMLLAYCGGVCANYLLPGRPWWMRGLLGSALLVVLDTLIEPVAIHYDFWSWHGQEVPLSNYIGWFLVALPLLSAFAWLMPRTRNIVAVALFSLQFLFFLLLNLAG